MQPGTPIPSSAATGAAAASVERLLRADPDLTPTDPGRQARFVVATIESLIHRFVGRVPEFDAADLEREIVTIVTRYLY
ncbi:hypothetical protein AB0L65_61865 [Nonomuraea sp. NPDC052116]|uniref:hypothetical protein n=1 Tax=Nonomuraea sp. NPDC052116 TaxID=3155665 RepID=UPI0034490FFC